MLGFDPRQDIRAAQVQLLYEQLPSALIATVLNAFILVAVLWQDFYGPLLLGWLAVVLATVLVRFLQRRSYFRNLVANSGSIEWGRRHLYGVGVNAALWAFAAFFFFVRESLLHQVFLAFVLMGMVSGSLSTLSSSRGAHVMFLATPLPYAVRLIQAGDSLHLAMTAMLIVYVTMMGRIGFRIYNTVTESLRLRFENLDLLEALRKSHSELERRVAERTAELKSSEDALRRADRLKDEFLAMLGHELRNPLAPIRNALEVMNHPAASESTMRWAREVIVRQTERLTRLVNDLLDVSRIMYGKISLHAEMIEIAKVVQDAVEASLPVIEARRQNLTVDVPSSAIWIQGDLVRLDQVVSNLLNNAAKYSDFGGSIRLKVEASDEWVTVRVQDNGVGIAPEVLPYVFDLFAQANHSLARTQGGLGIGLTVVKRLTEMHGGRVEARSEGLGRGSEFLIYLPRRQPEREMQMLSVDQNKKAEGSVRVLVVDDNHDAADTLATLMTIEGYTVAAAYDGPGAISEASRFLPDVILLDIGMPGMDGYQVAKELRTREYAKSTILIALTGYGQPEDRERSRAAGFNDHLTKPVDPDVLYGMLKTYCTPH